MHHHYQDIRDRIAEPPRWWDENAVPRYCEFEPDETADIYADEVALVEIGCQGCGTRFLVTFSESKGGRMIWAARLGKNELGPSLADRVRDRSLHYGDPPNAGCCPAGPTMNCDDYRVVQFWQKDTPFKWVRVPELEIDIEGLGEEFRQDANLNDAGSP